MKRVLVTGGAGYIGSHTLFELIKLGYDVVSIDNFSNSTDGNFRAIKELTGYEVVNHNVDLCDRKEVASAFQKIGKVDALIHFAAYKYVGESSRYPIRYYYNNLTSWINVLDQIESNEIKDVVFSSSCTVYGNPEELPVREDTPMGYAQSAYGETKQMCENILVRTNELKSKFRSVILRYFNPAGIDESGQIFETTQKKQETLIPIIEEVHNGKRPYLEVFGDDYDTRDGTAIRDYIHVTDLAKAHVNALSFLEDKELGRSEVINLGVGNGVSVYEMIRAAEKVFEKEINYKIGPRRVGDASKIYASVDKAKELLGWEPKLNIDDIYSSINKKIK